MSDERAFWQEIHRALDIVVKAIVRYKLSQRVADRKRPDEDEVVQTES